MSLLKKPSAAMSKMIDSCERVTTPTGLRIVPSNIYIISFRLYRNTLFLEPFLFLTLYYTAVINTVICNIVFFI